MAENVIFVDENDQPIGSGDREEAWEKGLHLRVVRLVIKDENGRILSQHRAKSVRANPDLWTNSAGGHVDAGEYWDDAANRELFEEIGIKTKLRFVGEFIHKEDTNNRKIRQFSKCYEGIVDSNTNFILQEEEVSEVKWFELDDLLKQMEESPDRFTPAFTETMEKFYR